MKLDFHYQPLPKQLEFHNAQQKFKVLVGGMGSGKTLPGIFESLTIALTWPKNLGLIGRATYPELRDSTRKNFLDFPVICDGKEYSLLGSPLVKSWNKSENHLTLINGTEILFRALQDSFDKIKSLNLGFYWIDELTEIPEEMWLGLVGRLRRKNVGHYGLGTTNPEGHDWVWKRFYQNPDEHHACFQMSSHENIYLPPGYVESMEQNFPEEWVKRYVLGSFDTFEGLIYHEFNEKSHTVTPFEIPDDWYRFVALDHGYRNPTAVLWFAVSPKGEVFVYDELYERRTLISSIAEIIHTKCHGQDIRRFLIDPSCYAKGPATGLSIVEEYEKSRLYFDAANNDVRAGINRVKEYLKNNKLKVFKSCTNLLTEIGQYKWKDLKPGAMQDAPEKPVKKNDHAIDALRYGVAYLYSAPEITVKKKGWNWRDYLPTATTVTENWKAA